jgi:hypothetical protein
LVTANSATQDSSASLLTSLLAGYRLAANFKLKVTLQPTVSQRWCQAPSGGPRSDFCYCQTVVVLQSHITTDGQSANPSWCQAPYGAEGQTFVAVRQLKFCRCGAPSLKRGWVCHLSWSCDFEGPMKCSSHFAL